MEIKATLYDETIHGKMTDEERAIFNSNLLNSIPDRDPADQFAHMQYTFHMKNGDVEKANEFKDGYERDCEWLKQEDAILRSRLKTKEEMKAMIHRDLEGKKMLSQVAVENGLNGKIAKDLLKATHSQI